jgi:hypothetical protein
MRTLILLAVVLGACAPKEAATPDSVATVAPAPVALTADMVSGTWNGVSMAEGSDSVTFRWTTTQVSDSEGLLKFEGTSDAVPFTRTFDADSMIATSGPYTPPGAAGGPKLTFRSVGRLVDGKLVGTSVNMLADKPDSVVARGRWEATR